MCHYGNDWCRDISDTTHECGYPPRTRDRATEQAILLDAIRTAEGEDFRPELAPYVPDYLALAVAHCVAPILAQLTERVDGLAAREIL